MPPTAADYLRVDRDRCHRWVHSVAAASLSTSASAMFVGRAYWPSQVIQGKEPSNICLTVPRFSCDTQDHMLSELSQVHTHRNEQKNKKTRMGAAG